jgi:hypothetical protein
LEFFLWSVFFHFMLPNLFSMRVFNLLLKNLIKRVSLKNLIIWHIVCIMSCLGPKAHLHINFHKLKLFFSHLLLQ